MFKRLNIFIIQYMDHNEYIPYNVLIIPTNNQIEFLNLYACYNMSHYIYDNYL